MGLVTENSQSTVVRAGCGIPTITVATCSAPGSITSDAPPAVGLHGDARAAAISYSLVMHLLPMLTIGYLGQLAGLLLRLRFAGSRR